MNNYDENLTTSSETPLRTVTSDESLSIGDILYRRKGIVMHVGVYIGNALILHNTPKNGEHSVAFDTFANGKTVYAQTTNMLPLQVLNNAQKILAEPQDYQLFKSNCEHTASRVLKSNPTSAQLDEIMAWALIGGAFGKSIGVKSMYLGGVLGALGGLISLPRMFWIR